MPNDNDASRKARLKFNCHIRPKARCYERTPLAKIDRIRAEEWLVAEVMATSAEIKRAISDSLGVLGRHHGVSSDDAVAIISHAIRHDTPHVRDEGATAILGYAHGRVIDRATTVASLANTRAVGVSPSSHLEGEALTFNGIDEAFPSLSLTQRQIMQVCADVEKMLLDKNRKYGDSALNPKRIFSKADVIEQIKVRIDDKLSRIESAQSDEDEDVIDDLIGYLVLLKVAMMRQGTKGQTTRERRFDELHRRFDREIDARPSGRPEGKRKGR